MNSRYLASLALLMGGVSAQVTSQRIIDAAKTPADWLTYSGGYSGWRHSPLSQINRSHFLC